MASYAVFNFFKDFIYFLREKGGRKRGRETSACGFAHPPTGDLACNPGMCPDWELNQQPFGSQAGAQSIEQPSQDLFLIFLILK